MSTCYLELSVLGRVPLRGKQFQRITSPDRVYHPFLRVFDEQAYFIEKGIRERGIRDGGDLKVSLEIRNMEAKLVLSSLQEYLVDHSGFRGSWKEREGVCEIEFPKSYLDNGELEGLVAAVSKWEDWLPEAKEGQS